MRLPYINELGCLNQPTDINCTEVMEPFLSKESPLWKCMIDYTHKVGLIATLEEKAERICRTRCTNKTDLKKWEKYCKHMHLEDLGHYRTFNFRCDIDSYTESYELPSICDGKIQCKNNFDELKCPGRFYCSTDETITWIDKSRVCDQRKDCTNGKDECAGCIMDGLASSEFLIKSKAIAAIAILAGLSITIINIIVAIQTIRSETSSKAAQIDRLLRLQICFYDLLMGVYLSLMIVAAILLRFKGDYCELDEEWRASIFCTMFGVIFSVSSHGSLLMIAIMSIVRCIKCTRGNSIELSTRAIMILTMIVSLLNLCHAILPTLPVPHLQNFFRTSIYLVAVERNPFISSREGSQMIEQAREIHSHFFDNSSSADIPRILADLKYANITSDDTIFDVSDIGYYGNTPLCISNIFKMQESYRLYKVFYSVVVSILLIAMSVAYIIIVIKAKSSRQQAGSNNNDNTSQLTLKVSLMTIFQLVSWVSFIAAVVFFTWVRENFPPAKIFEIFALIVIPVNSLLNPIFYSGLYKSITSFLWFAWRKCVEIILARNGVQDPANEIEAESPTCRQAYPDQPKE